MDEDVFRTGQGTAVLERADYRSIRSPEITYAAFLFEKNPIIIVDWISTKEADGIGVVLPDGSVIPLRFAPDAMHRSEGTFLFSNFVYPKMQYSEEWERIIRAGTCRVYLMTNGRRVSDEISVRMLGRQHETAAE